MQASGTSDPVRIGDYAVLGRLGHGAMGRVFLARSPGGRPVAVKVIRPELADDSGFRERFRQEVAAMRAVGGFWTAAVVDADPDALWLATEYVPGPTLHTAVTSHGPLPVPALRRLVAGLAEALAAIHGTGLVHRDLKPANVLLAADGPRVIDFGIAKALESVDLTATGMFVGTPGFLSPEQIEGRDATPASDVFALGAVLVYAATGAGPFGTGDAAGLLYRAVHADPDLARVPAELRGLLARCLARDPSARPSPADLLAEVGTPDAAEWLPAPVRAMVTEQETELGSPQPRPPTKVYTQAGPPLPFGARAAKQTKSAKPATMPASPAPEPGAPGQPAAAQPGVVQSSSAEPAAAQSAAAQLSPVQPAAQAQSAVAQSSQVQPGVAQHPSADPAAAQPRSAEPAAAQSAAAPSSSGEPAAAQLAAAQPVSAQPGVAQHPSVQSAAAQFPPAQPAPAQSPPAQPGTALPGAAQPVPALPGAAPPSGSRAVFRVSRVSALVLGAVTTVVAFVCLSVSQQAGAAGDRGGGLVFFCPVRGLCRARGPAVVDRAAVAALAGGVGRRAHHRPRWAGPAAAVGRAGTGAHRRGSAAALARGVVPRARPGRPRARVRGRQPRLPGRPRAACGDPPARDAGAAGGAGLVRPRRVRPQPVTLLAGERSGRQGTCDVPRSTPWCGRPSRRPTGRRRTRCRR